MANRGVATTKDSLMSGTPTAGQSASKASKGKRKGWRKCWKRERALSTKASTLDNECQTQLSRGVPRHLEPFPLGTCTICNYSDWRAYQENSQTVTDLLQPAGIRKTCGIKAKELRKLGWPTVAWALWARSRNGIDQRRLEDGIKVGKTPAARLPWRALSSVASTSLICLPNAL